MYRLVKYADERNVRRYMEQRHAGCSDHSIRHRRGNGCEQWYLSDQLYDGWRLPGNEDGNGEQFLQWQSCEYDSMCWF